MPLKKNTIIILLSMMASCVFAQQKDTLQYYLDINDAPIDALHAAFILKVYKENPADQLWKREYLTKPDHKLLSIGYCIDLFGKIKQGDYKLYDYNGILDKTGHFENNQYDGNWIGYYTSGKIASSYNFSLGKMTGLSRAWFENGKLEDSFNLDKAGNGYGVGYYEDGPKKYEGFFADGVKKGEWRYYYDIKGSHQSMSCVFEKDSLLSSKCFTTDGQPQNKNCYYEREAEFIGGHDAWIKYLVKKIGKSKYIDYLKAGQQYTVVVKFVVDEEGTVTDAMVEKTGSSERLDNIAEDIIRQSPHWQPALMYNQPVKAYRRQPITFMAQAQ